MSPYTREGGKDPARSNHSRQRLGAAIAANHLLFLDIHSQLNKENQTLSPEESRRRQN